MQSGAWPHRLSQEWWRLSPVCPSSSLGKTFATHLLALSWLCSEELVVTGARCPAHMEMIDSAMEKEGSGHPATLISFYLRGL